MKAHPLYCISNAKSNHVTYKKYDHPEGKTLEDTLAQVKGCCQVVRVDDGRVFARHSHVPNVWLTAVYLKGV